MTETFDPQALLSKPLDQIKAPIKLPLGSYVGIAIKREFDKAKNEKETPIVRYTVRPTEALPDVDAEALALATNEAEGGKPLHEAEQRLEFWLTPDAVHRLKEWGEEHCKVDPNEVSTLAELIEASLNRPFIFTLVSAPNKRDPSKPYVNIGQTAPIPED